MCWTCCVVPNPLKYHTCIYFLMQRYRIICTKSCCFSLGLHLKNRYICCCEIYVMIFSFIFMKGNNTCGRSIIRFFIYISKKLKNFRSILKESAWKLYHNYTNSNKRSKLWTVGCSGEIKSLNLIFISLYILYFPTWV